MLRDLLTKPGFYYNLLLAWAPIIIAAVFTAADDWLCGAQVRHAYQKAGLPVPEKYLTFLGHGMVWGLFLIGPVAAGVLTLFGEQWNSITLFRVFAGSALFGAIQYAFWIRDPVHAALGDNGRATVAGILINVLSLPFVVTAGLMYYLFTPSPEWVWPITIAFGIYMWMALCLPPWAVHGKVHNPARWMTAAACVGLIVLAART